MDFKLNTHFKLENFKNKAQIDSFISGPKYEIANYKTYAQSF